jgi:hypothetical protein
VLPSDAGELLVQIDGRFDGAALMIELSHDGVGCPAAAAVRSPCAEIGGAPEDTSTGGGGRWSIHYRARHVDSAQGGMMMLTRLLPSLLATTLLTWNVAAAEEFELYGYKQGMTLEQANQIAVSQNQRLQSLQLPDAPNHVAYGVFGSAEDANDLATLSFCHDRLNRAAMP